MTSPNAPEPPPEAQSEAPEAPRGHRDWRWWLTPGALLGITVLAIAGMFWGKFVAPPVIAVTELDAGGATDYAIGDVRAFPNLEVFVVAMEDGRLRALDARVASNGCVVEWVADDARGSVVNPFGRAGAFVDPCSGAAWALTGDQVLAAGSPEPLRTFHITYDTLPDGVQHVYVEVVGRTAPAGTP